MSSRINCDCHSRWGWRVKCTCNSRDGCYPQMGNVCYPQYGGTCTAHSCNVRSGGVVSPSRPHHYWTDPVLNNSVPIKSIHIGEIRRALDAELSVRNLPRLSSSSNPSTNMAIPAYVYTEIRDALNLVRRRDGFSSFYFSDPYTPGSLITGLGTMYFRQYLDILRNVCMCQCNYDCSCNCNYCTCNCNHCICNCNWGCTCDCDYSDERLKENIEYF